MGLAVAFAHDEVERTEDGSDVGEEVAGDDGGKDRERDEARAADAEAVGDAAAVGDDVEAERALRVLGLEVDFAGRDLRAFGDQHEVLDELFHLRHHLRLGREEDLLRVFGIPGAARHRLHDLADDAHGLAELFHADEVAVEAVALHADGDVEVILLVARVGLVLAEVERHAGSAEVRAGEAVGEGHLLRDGGDAFGALEEDAVAGEELVDLVDRAFDAVAEGRDLGEPAVRDVARHAADAGVARGEAGAGEFFEERVELLALVEGVHEHRPRAGIHRVDADAEEVGRDAGHLAGEHADRFAAGGQLEAGEFLDGDRVGDVVGERGEVVQAVRVRDELVIRHVLGDLLVAAVQVADDRVALHDLIAVELEAQAEHAVRGRVGRTHVQGHVLSAQFFRTGGDVADGDFLGDLHVKSGFGFFLGPGLVERGGFAFGELAAVRDERAAHHRRGLDLLAGDFRDVGGGEGDFDAGEREVLAERVIRIRIPHQDAARVRVAFEDDAEHVERFALVPVGAGVQRRDARDAVVDGVDVQAHVFLVRRAEEMDDDAEADRAALQLEAAEVGEQVEALFVAQGADDGEEVAAGDAEGRHVLAGEVLRGRETGGERGGVHVRV